MITFLIIIVAIAFIVAVNELIILQVYGPWTYEYTLNKNHASLNSLDPQILVFDWGNPYISTVGTAVFVKYYIDDIGVVPRGCDLHYEIKNLYDNLNK